MHRFRVPGAELARDEGIRSDTSIERLAALRPPRHKRGPHKSDMEAARAALAASEFPDGFEMDYAYVTGDVNEDPGRGRR